MSEPSQTAWHDGRSFVVFGDMLGFASMVERHSDVFEEDLKRHHREWQPELEKNLLPSSRPGSLSHFSKQKQFALERKFILFNTLLSRQIDHVAIEAQSTVVVFSDCFFVAMNDAALLLSLCAQIAGVMTLNAVPLRMGVAQGTFSLHDVSSSQQVTRRRSVAQFFGKGIVRSHFAESSGLKGVRIGLHPSIVANLTDLDPSIVIPLVSRERRKHCTHELNYLHPRFVGDALGPDSVKAVQGAIVQSVRDMAQEVQGSPRRVTIQYARTMRAHQRMLRRARFA